MDKANVIKGLEMCKAPISCGECPYHKNYMKCETALHDDVLELLKQQDAEIAFLKGMQLQTTKGMSDQELGIAVEKMLGLR